MEVDINYDMVFFNWISKWFSDAEKRKKDGKPPAKMYYGKIISILLKKKMRQFEGSQIIITKVQNPMKKDKKEKIY